MTIKRRTVLKGLGATAGASALGMPAIAQGASFKLGLMTVKTGPLAQGGIQMEQGLTLYLKERNNMLAGRPVQLITGDSAGAPAVARTKMQEFVDQGELAGAVTLVARHDGVAVTDR